MVSRFRRRPAALPPALALLIAVSALPGQGSAAAPSAGAPDPLSAAAQAVLGATWLQASAVGLPLAAPPETTALGLAGSVAAAAADHGVALSAADEEELRRLADADGPLAPALARLVDALRAYERAGVDVATSLAAADARPPSAAGLAPAQAQAAVALLSARLLLLDAARGLDDARPSTTPVGQAAACQPLKVSNLLSLDLAGCDTTYDRDVWLLVDVGGNDLYLNNAGGAVGGAAAVVDLGGNDRYVSGRSDGANGGGFGGAGFLLDDGGDDVYAAGGLGTNGGGTLGAGFLLDTEGDDAYTAGDFGTNGGTDGGIGFLLDGRGNDRYAAGSNGANGGADTGVGLLLDLSGGDRYEAKSRGANGGGIFGGAGFLLDLAGDDAYTAGTLGVNGGGVAGTGLLLDGGGRDTYLDGEGGTGVDRTVVPKFLAGAQVDSPVPLVPGSLPGDPDADRVPEALEPLLCQVEDRNTPLDGACAGDDYDAPFL